MKNFRIVCIACVAWIASAMLSAFFSGRVNAWCGERRIGENAVFSTMLAPVAVVVHAFRWVEVKSAGRCP